MEKPENNQTTPLNPPQTPVNSPESSGKFETDFPAAPAPMEVNATTSDKTQTSEPATSTPANEFITSSTVTHGSKRNGFLKFIIIGIIIIASIYGVVFYIYLENKKIKDGEPLQQEAQPEVSEDNQIPQPTTFAREFVKLVNGNIVYESPSESKILINKESYSSTGIIGFAKVAVSPDNSRLCFESWPPAAKPAVYLSNADGSAAEEISPNSRYCNFTPDSKKIIYEKLQGGVGDISMYEIDLMSETNLTPETVDSDFPKTFGLVGLSADGSKAICNFVGSTDDTLQGQCEIDLSTREVVFR